jgi:hypothetical protein
MAFLTNHARCSKQWCDVGCAGRVAVMIAMGAAAWLASTQRLWAQSASSDTILLDPRYYPIRAGVYSVFADFQREVYRRSCQPTRVGAPEHPGFFDKSTAQAIVSLVACPPFNSLPVGSAAYQGAVTVGLWRLLLPHTPPPGVPERTRVMTLTFEATDFNDLAEWNFCQDNPEIGSARRAAAREGRCINSTDPCSMLTWGPRGATAGQGREIQYVLWRLLQRRPQDVSDAFGSEVANVLRFVRMQGLSPDQCDGGSLIEHFMCAVWLDDERRQQWEQGLLHLGRLETTRQIYNELYAEFLFDGEKLARYERLWLDLALVPSEIDEAFFLDRATHIGGPPLHTPELVSELAVCMKQLPSTTDQRAAARRCLALRHRHPTQPTDRLGRDVSYYLEGFDLTKIPQSEWNVWDRHIPILATRNFGLSDRLPGSVDLGAVRQPAEVPPPQEDVELTITERSCPLAVRAPLRRSKR